LPSLNPHENKFVLHRNYTPIIFRVARKWREEFSVLRDTNITYQMIS